MAGFALTDLMCRRAPYRCANNSHFPNVVCEISVSSSAGVMQIALSAQETGIRFALILNRESSNENKSTDKSFLLNFIVRNIKVGALWARPGDYAM